MANTRHTYHLHSKEIEEIKDKEASKLQLI